MFVVLAISCIVTQSFMNEYIQGGLIELLQVLQGDTAETFEKYHVRSRCHTLSVLGIVHI